MDSDRGLDMLYRYAADYRFSDFTELYARLLPGDTGGDLAEALLMRAQIKLYSGDVTFLVDLEAADARGVSPRYPALGGSWRLGSPNRFVVFPGGADAWRSYTGLLPRAGELLGRWYGGAGEVMVDQLRDEILYFQGKIDEALGNAQRRLAAMAEGGFDALLADYLMFRCHLAAGQPGKAEDCMLDMIKMGRTYPECAEPYKGIRDWAILTTGWSGDTPRFRSNPDGDVLSVLDDRLAAMRNGFYRLSPAEEPFAVFAGEEGQDFRTVRQHNMDVFHAVYRFHTGDMERAKLYFRRAYQVAEGTGMIMAFVEYGAQVLPLLDYAARDGGLCPAAWIETVTPFAERYEASLEEYRA